jgi:hypothetical protein
MPDVLFWVMVLYSLLSVFGTIAAVVSVFTSDWSWKRIIAWLLVIIFVPLGWLIYFLLK